MMPLRSRPESPDSRAAVCPALVSKISIPPPPRRRPARDEDLLEDVPGSPRKLAPPSPPAPPQFPEPVRPRRDLFGGLRRSSPRGTGSRRTRTRGERGAGIWTTNDFTTASWTRDRIHHLAYVANFARAGSYWPPRGQPSSAGARCRRGIARGACGVIVGEAVRQPQVPLDQAALLARQWYGHRRPLRSP